MVERLILAAWLAAVAPSALAAPLASYAPPLVPNGSFESGRGDAPSDWQLSGGIGTWENEGRTGSRCLSVTGDGKSSNFWSCPTVKHEKYAFNLYRIEFWTKSSPDATGGSIISGTNFCNVDWHHSTDWTHHSIIFQVPERNDSHFLRFGQWQVKGKVYFDDIRITEVRPIHSFPEGVGLGEGETIRSGRYEFVAPLKQNLNYSRPVFRCTAGFNSTRWLLDGDAEICLYHDLLRISREQEKTKMRGLLLSDARVEVDVGYYVAGRCVIEAREYYTTWTTIGEIDGLGSREFRLPRSFDVTHPIMIRLVGRRKEGQTKPCSLQIHGYRFSAAVAEKELSLTGGTYFVHEDPQVFRPEDLRKPETAKTSEPTPLPASLLDVGTPVLGGLNRIQMSVWNDLPGPTRIVPVVTIDEVTQTYPGREILPTSVSTKLEIPYHSGHSGSHQARISLLNAKTSETLYTATWDYRVPSLYDSGFGYALTSDDACGVWWAEGTYKINRRCPMPERQKSIAISAAKGEYEPFQLVLAPKHDLRNVRVNVSALRSNSGAQIPAEAIAICRVGYVNVTDPTDEIGCAGEWPDPLPPLDKPFDLRAADGVQPLWFTVHVPRDAAAGDYQGTIDLAADDWKTTVPFAVHVWNFEIPRENHLRTAFGFSTGNVRRYHNLTSDDELRQVVDLYFKNFAEHRISPYDFAPFDPIQVQFPKEADGAVKVDFSRFDRQAEKYLGPDYRFSTFRLSLSGMGGGTFHARRPGRIGRFDEDTPEYQRLFTDYLRQLESHLRDKGWLDNAFVYWFDEPEPKDYDFVRAGMERIHRAAPGLRRMLTEQPEKELDGAVDIWCPVSPNVKPDDVAKERAKGNGFWWYICTGPKGPYCTLFIDHFAIEFRMWSWQTWKLGIQGLLIWQSNYWTSDAAFPPPQIQNPWEDPMSYTSGYSTPAGTKKHWGNGDGRFLYPPNRDPMNDKSKYLVGPVNSIRWEMLREGIEDYEYLWLLRDLVEKAKKRGDKSEALTRAESLLTIPDSITRDQTHFTHDPLDLYRYRENMARAIEWLSN